MSWKVPKRRPKDAAIAHGPVELRKEEMATSRRGPPLTHAMPSDKSQEPRYAEIDESYTAAPTATRGSLGGNPPTGMLSLSISPTRRLAGVLTHIEIGAFLREGTGPEHQALLRLVGTLVDVPPYAERT